MATKTINLKMILDQSDKPEATELRQALWTTHEQINKSVAEIERVLLLCRGRAYLMKDEKGEDKLMDEKDVQKQTLDYARKVQIRNGKRSVGTDEELLNALRQLYEALVPSVLPDEEGNPRKGTAQQAKPYCTPLMLKGSKGGKDAQKKVVEPLPQWVSHKENWRDESLAWANTEEGKAVVTPYEDERGKLKEGWQDSYIEDHRHEEPLPEWVSHRENWEQESIEWINSEEGKAVLANFDRKNTWIKLQTGWQDIFVKDQQKQRAKLRAGGIVVVLSTMEKLKLLPLIVPPITVTKKENAKESVGAWNQLCFKKAIEHLLTWESWNHRCAREYSRLSDEVRKREQAYGSIDALIRDKIDAYQTQRHQELKKLGLATDERLFTITPRMLRAFDRVKEEWCRPNCSTMTDRERKLADLQTQLRGRFGDPDLYLWLAKEDNEGIWKHPDNPLQQAAQLNALRRMLARRKPQSTYTVPDPIKHPKWAQFEAPGGTNLKNYTLSQEKRLLTASFPLLCQREDKRLEEKSFTVRLAPSGQIGCPEISPEDNGRLIFDYADEKYTASLGASDILFGRSYLEHRKREDIRTGQIGSVWFKLVLDIEPKAPDGWLDAKGRPKSVSTIHHFRSGLLTNDHAKDIEAGLRVLTVDLGIRTFASCSVFELVKGEPEKGLRWLADHEKDLWAKHERSFILTMPGDDISPDARNARHQAYEELNRLRQGKDFIRRLLRMSVMEDIEQRKKEFARVCGIRDRFTGREAVFHISDDEQHNLESYLDRPVEVWNAQVKPLFDHYEACIASEISSWRRRTRRKTKARDYEIGKSYWGIQYLEDVRDFLRGWSTHARIGGKITRWNREKQGTFANRLLNHIKSKKKDRIKTGADLIIQSARGLVYNDKAHRWEPKFAPCRLILFEDLARYRFQTDRPPRENAQLMRWSHRKIKDEVTQQAALYGIHIETTGAGFSSRFYARNGAPGIRAKKLTRQDVEYINANEHVRKRLLESGFGEAMVREGAIVPWEGGEFFVSFSREGKLDILHADINAAQNLQRRFWTRFADSFRVPVRQVDDAGSEWLPQSDGPRIRGGLSAILGTSDVPRFIQAEDGGFAIHGGKGKKVKPIGDGDEVELDELTEELMEQGIEADSEDSKGKTVFFRDASGIILRSDRFYPSKEFWGTVHRRISEALRKRYESSPF